MMAWIFFGILCGLGIWRDRPVPIYLFGSFSLIGLGFILLPAQLKPVRHSELHIRLSEELGEETNLYNLRDLIFDQPGECSLYLHVAGNNAGREWVIKASPAITVSADETCIHRMLTNPQVKEVWKE